MTIDVIRISFGLDMDILSPVKILVQSMTYNHFKFCLTATV